MADKVHATAASPKASWGLRSGAHQRWKQQMGGICVTSLSFTVPFFVSDTFTGKYWGLQLLLYKLKYKAMKKYESNSKSQGLNRNIWRIVDGYWWSLLQVCLNLTMQCVVFGKGTFLTLVCSSGAATHEGLLMPVKPFRTSRLHRVVHLRWNKAASTQPPLWTRRTRTASTDVMLQCLCRAEHVFTF